MESFESFKKLYSLSVSKHRKRVPIIEHYLGIIEPADVSEDDRRNEPAFYSDLAHDRGHLLSQCLGSLVAALRAVAYEESAQVFTGLEFLQSILANMLWRYGLDVAEHLETFTRDFDRLDVPDERLRLYQMAQDREILG